MGGDHPCSVTPFYRVTMLDGGELMLYSPIQVSSVVTDVLICTGDPIQDSFLYTGEGSLQVLCIGSALLCGLWEALGLVERWFSMNLLEGP